MVGSLLLPSLGGTDGPTESWISSIDTQRLNTVFTPQVLDNDIK
jgi:hypothetical protein